MINPNPGRFLAFSHLCRPFRIKIQHPITGAANSTRPIPVETSNPRQQCHFIVAKLGLVAVNQQEHQKIVSQVTLEIENQYSSQAERFPVSASVGRED